MSTLKTISIQHPNSNSANIGLGTDGSVSVGTGMTFRPGEMNIVGVATATMFSGNITGTAATFTGPITAASASFSGNVSIAGTLTYEDVTNVDSVGLVTARSGANITGGNVLIGSASSTGTASQPLQVTGGAYISNSVGVGTTNPRATVQVGTAITQSVFISSSGNVGLASTAPRVSLDASQETDAIALPQGTTAQRPTGNSPYLRWNTTNSALEFYNGTAWVEIISDYFPSGSTILG